VTSGKVVTTIGYERRYNPSLQFREVDSFVEHMTREQPPRPANMQNIVAINQGRKPCTMDDPSPPILDPATAARRIRSGCLALDVRPHRAFGAGHVPGAYNVEATSKSFEQSVGWILPPDEPLVLVVEHDAEVRAAARKLAFVGLDARIEGGLTLASWREAGHDLAGLEQMDVTGLRRAIDEGRVQVLDVRDADEWAAGTIDSATLTSFKHLPAELERLSLSPDRPVAVYCAGGMRSSTACSILVRRGFRQVYNVTGGIVAWRDAGLPLARR
jgi:hydroxyacylglutathione hydrolase